MSKDCPNCPAFGKHCPHKVNGDPYFYDCYLTVAELEKENAELKEEKRINKWADLKGGLKVVHKKNLEMYDQLTKAKNILKYVLNSFVGDLPKNLGYFDEEELKAMAEAENFLKESEVEK